MRLSPLHIRRAAAITVSLAFVVGVLLRLPSSPPAAAAAAAAISTAVPVSKVTAYTGKPGESFALIGLIRGTAPAGSGDPVPEAYVVWRTAGPDGVVQADFAQAFSGFSGELTTAAVRHARLLPSSPASSVRQGEAIVVTQQFSDPAAGRDWAGVLQGTWAATEYRSLAERGLTLSFDFRQSILRQGFFALVLRGLGWTEQVLPQAGGHLTGETARYLPDVDRAAIEAAVGRGLIKGRAPGDLALDQPLTRAEAATFLLRLAGVTPDPSLPNPFTDVPADHWAKAWVATAAARGVVGGYGGGLFGPQDTLTWEQGVALVFRQAVRGRSYGGELFGFYAIQAFDQRDAISSFNQMAFGWARLAAGGVLDLSGADFYWPSPATVTGPDGKPQQVGPTEILQSARGAGVRRNLMVYSGDQDDVLSNFLADGAAQAKFNSSLTALVEREGFDGVTLDFEGLGWGQEGQALATTRNRLTAYVVGLRRLLAAKGRTLTMAVHPTNSSYPGYDYGALAAGSDGLIIMAYEYAPGREPQPLKAVEKAVRDAAALAPPDKLLLGVNAYAETAETVKEKRDLAVAYNLRGVAIWRIGLLMPGFVDSSRAPLGR